MNEILICKQCRNEIKGRGKIFCGHTCRQVWVNINNNPAKREEVKKKISQSRKGKPTTLGRILPQSQKDNMRKALEGRTLTAEQRANIGRGVKRAGVKPPRNTHLIGDRHPNWKGGLSTQRQKDFSTSDYKKYRKTVLERDYYTCQDCGQKNVRLEVHHILPYASYPHLKYNLNNAITLCFKCHKAKHSGVPRPKAIV